MVYFQALHVRVERGAGGAAGHRDVLHASESALLVHEREAGRGTRFSCSGRRWQPMFLDNKAGGTCHALPTLRPRDNDVSEVKQRRWSQNFKSRVNFKNPLHRKIQNYKPWFLVSFVQQYFEKVESLPKYGKIKACKKII